MLDLDEQSVWTILTVSSEENSPSTIVDQAKLASGFRNHLILYKALIKIGALQHENAERFQQA